MSTTNRGLGETLLLGHSASMGDFNHSARLLKYQKKPRFRSAAISFKAMAVMSCFDKRLTVPSTVLSCIT